jgi:putative FmdB family regulatory protein
MPLYDFKCLNCKAVFEAARPMGSSEIPACTECGSERTEKKIAPPPVIFRGDGFYKTDSTKTPPKKPETEKTTEPKKAETVETPKTSAKPEKTQASEV